jgi:CBS domain-containing protein
LFSERKEETMKAVKAKEKFVTVGDLAQSRRCLTFLPEQFVRVILPAMQQNGAGAAGVLDEEGSLVGLLTERALLKRVFRMATDPLINPANLGKYIDDMTVAEVMVPRPECLADDMDIEEALGRMSLRGFRFMPVVTRADPGQLVGIADERELALLVQSRLREVRRSEAESRSLLSYLFHEPYGTGYSAQGA